jgi:hypothetical protein
MGGFFIASIIALLYAKPAYEKRIAELNKGDRL